MSFRIQAVEHRKCAAGLDCLTHTSVSSEVSDFMPCAHRGAARIFLRGG